MNPDDAPAIDADTRTALEAMAGAIPPEFAGDMAANLEGHAANWNAVISTLSRLVEGSTADMVLFVQDHPTWTYQALTGIRDYARHRMATETTLAALILPDGPPR